MFKKGDKVRFNQPTNPSGGTYGAWVYGAIYEVDHAEKGYVNVVEDSRGIPNGWKASYFDLVEDEKPIKLSVPLKICVDFSEMKAEIQKTIDKLERILKALD